MLYGTHCQQLPILHKKYSHEWKKPEFQQTYILGYYIHIVSCLYINNSQ